MKSSYQSNEAVQYLPWQNVDLESELLEFAFLSGGYDSPWFQSIIRAITEPGS